MKKRAMRYLLTALLVVLLSAALCVGAFAADGNLWYGKGYITYTGATINDENLDCTSLKSDGISTVINHMYSGCNDIEGATATAISVTTGTTAHIGEDEGVPITVSGTNTKLQLNASQSGAVTLSSDTGVKLAAGVSAKINGVTYAASTPAEVFLGSNSRMIVSGAFEYIGKSGESAVTLQVNGNLTINNIGVGTTLYNGYGNGDVTVSVTSNSGCELVINGTGVTTVTGGTGNGNGKLSVNDTSTVNASGKFKMITVRGGTLTDTAALTVSNSDEAYALKVEGSGKATLDDGGSIIGTNASATGAVWYTSTAESSITDYTINYREKPGIYMNNASGSLRISGGEISPQSFGEGEAAYINSGKLVLLNNVEVMSCNNSNTIYVGEGGTLEIGASDSTASGVTMNAFSNEAINNLGTTRLYRGEISVLRGADKNTDYDVNSRIANHYGGVGIYNEGTLEVLGGKINVNTKYATPVNAYGIYHKKGTTTIGNTTIRATADTANDLAVGLYAESGTVNIFGQAKINAIAAVANVRAIGVQIPGGGAVVQSNGSVRAGAADDAVTEGSYYGVYNEGTYTLTGSGKVFSSFLYTADSYENYDAAFTTAVTNAKNCGTVMAFGDSTSYIYGGTIDAFGGTGICVGDERAEVYMRGGTLTMHEGSLISNAVRNNGGLFELGVHGQTALPAAGTAYTGNDAATDVTGAQYGCPVINGVSSGVYASDSDAVVRLYAGRITTSADNSEAVAASSGAELQILTGAHDGKNGAQATVLEVTANGTDSTAVYIGEDTYWAIRGRGGVFTGKNALGLMSEFGDKGYDGSSGTEEPLSGGTFKGLMLDYSTYLLATNCYLRDDSGVNAADYGAASDGTRRLVFAEDDGRATTVVDAEWELRTVLASASGSYNMPIDITLGASLNVHGMAAAAAGEIDVNGTHTLYLNGKVLTNVADSVRYVSDKIIEICTGEALTVEGKGWSGVAYVASPNFNWTIPGTTGKTITVNGGIIYDNTDAVKSCAIYVDDGTLTVNGGTIAGKHNSSEAYGIYSNGTLNVNGGYVCGGAGNSSAVYIKNGTVSITGGTIGDADDAAAVYIDGGETTIDTNAEHDIGYVKVTNGKLNIDATDEDYPTGIDTLYVGGGTSSSVGGSVLFKGGTINDYVEVYGYGELKATGGEMCDMYVGGNANVVLAGDSTECVELEWAGIEGNATFIVEYAKIDRVDGFYDSDDSASEHNAHIELHGGLYKMINNCSYFGDSSDKNFRYIGYNPDGDELIPYNHYVAGVTTGKLYRTDTDFAEAAGGDEYLEIKHILDAGSPYDIYNLENGKYTLPCFVDVGEMYDEDGCETSYSFRGASTNLTCCAASVDAMTLEIADTYVLDLDGYAITNSYGGAGPFNIVANGSLTVQDTNDDPDGEIYDDSNTAVVVSGGILKLRSGGLRASGTETLGIEGGEVYIYGGKVSSTNSGPAIHVVNDGSLTVYDGIIDAPDSTMGISFISTGKLVIKGGDVDAKKDAVYINNSRAEVAISGGRFGCDRLDSAFSGGIYVQEAGTVNLTGGTYWDIITNDPELTKLIDLVPDTRVYVSAASVTARGDNYIAGGYGEPVTEIHARKPSTVVSRTSVAAVMNLADNYVLESSYITTSNDATWTDANGNKVDGFVATVWSYDAPFTVTLYDPPEIIVPSPSPKPDGQGAVTVDGESYDIAETATENGKTVLTVDSGKLQELLENAKESVGLIIEAGTGTNEARLTLKDFEIMAEKGIDLTFRAGGVDYTIPAGALDIADVLRSLHALKSSNVVITIRIAEAASQPKIDGATLVIPAFEFTVEASYDGNTAAIGEFLKYVTRRVTLTKEQAQKVSTAVVIGADGKARHVPTRIYQENGKWYAGISSLTNSVYALTNSPATFADTTGRWYESIVNEMASRRIIGGRGEGVFDGDAMITRAEFAALVVRALGLPEDGGAHFTDVASEDWFFGAVGKAFECGLIAGRGDGTFAPNEKISRQDAMLIVQRAAAITGYTSVKNAYGSYSDLGSAAAYASQAMYWNLENGFIVGANGLVRPGDNISRAESATIVLRLLQKSELVDVRAIV